VPHARRGSFPIRTGTTRRQTSWAGGPKSNTNGGLGSAFASSATRVGAVVSTALQDGLTLVRLRGELVFWLTSATATNQGYHGAIGVGNFTDAAIAVGVTALPAPLDEEGWDGWLYHRYFSCMSTGPIVAAAVSTEPGLASSVNAAIRLEVDSKAMRKTPLDTSLLVSVQMVLVGTAAASWTFNSRTLDKLP